MARDPEPENPNLRAWGLAGAPKRMPVSDSNRCNKMVWNDRTAYCMVEYRIAKDNIVQYRMVPRRPRFANSQGPVRESHSMPRVSPELPSNKAPSALGHFLGHTSRLT